MAGELLPARFSLRSQVWSRWTGKCFEAATSHMQNVSGKWWDILINIRQITTVNTRRFEFMTYLGLFCLILTWTTFFLWVQAFNAGTEQSERVQIFLNYFPSFLSVGAITLIDIILCIAAIIISSICLRLKGIGWKVLNIVIIVGCSLGLLLTLFGLM